MVRPGSGRFEVGFWVGFRVGLRARDFPTEGVLSRTPLIIRTVDQNQKEKNQLNSQTVTFDREISRFGFWSVWGAFGVRGSRSP